MTPAPVSLSDRVARLEQAVKEIRASLALRRGERQRFVMQGAEIVPVKESLHKDPEAEFDTALAGGS